MLAMAFLIPLAAGAYDLSVGALMALALSSGTVVPGLEEAIDRLAEWLMDYRAGDDWGVNWPYAVPLTANGAPDHTLRERRLHHLWSRRHGRAGVRTGQIDQRRMQHVVHGEPDGVERLLAVLYGQQVVDVRDADLGGIARIDGPTAGTGAMRPVSRSASVGAPFEG